MAEQMSAGPTGGTLPAPAGTVWLAPLRAAAAVARRATSSEADVLRAVGEEFRRLHLVGGVVLLTDTGELEARNHFLSPIVESTLTRLTGLSVRSYRFRPEDVPAYAEVFEHGEPRFFTERAPITRAVMPARFEPLLPVIMRLIGGNLPTILAPLTIGDRIIGVISLSARWLTSEHIPIMASLADHVAISLSQVRAREEMRAALERERLRNQVAQTVTSALELPVVLERIIELAVEISGADAGAIALIEQDGESLVFPYTFGLPDSIEFKPAKRGSGVAWWMIDQRQPLLLSEYGHHEHSMEQWVDAGLHAFIGLPLYVGDLPLGAMGLFKTSRGDTFQDEKLEQVESIGSMAAIAIHNAQLYRQVEQRVDESRALIQTSRSISASLDLETVLAMIAEQAKTLLKGDGSRIHMLDPDDNVLRTLVADDPDSQAMLSMELAPTDGLAGIVLQTGEPMLANDPVADDLGLQVPGTPDDELECLVLAPLNIRQRPLGVMAVRRIGVERPFKRADQQLLSAFAAHAAVAIENADLYGQIEKQAQRLEQEVVERTRDLALSEARYRGLVETSLTGILHVTPDGVISYVNQVFADMLAVSTDELEGQRLIDTSERFLAKERRETILGRFRDRIAGKRRATEMYEVEFLNSRGEPVPTLFAVHRIDDDQGLPQGVTCLVLDISARKSLETALRSERDRLEAILSSIGDAVIVTDPVGNIEYVNPAWERQNGYTRGEALARNLQQLHSEASGSEPFNELVNAMADESPWQGELIISRKDGTIYDSAVTLTPIHGPDGHVVNFVAVEHDISALKELDRLKSQFVSDVSHELRTPLTNIRLYVDLLGEKPASERSEEYLGTLNRESERLAHLIDDLLSLSRLESGATPFLPKPINLNDLLQDLAEDRRAMAGGKQLAIACELHPSLPPAQGDKRLLTQVFTNLLTNAMNYTPEGGQIDLRTHHVSETGGEWIVAEVEDTGLGIQEEEQAMIFRRFFRGYASQTTGAPGTGLGLAICREITELHGGRIEVDSRLEHGTRVSVWLPVATQTEPVA